MAKLIEPKDPSIVKKTNLAKLREDYIELAEQFNKVRNWELLTCPKCGNLKSAVSGFYMDKKFATDRYPICKECIQKEVEQRKNDREPSHECEESVKNVLRKMDRMWDVNFYRECVKSSQEGMNEKVRPSPFSTYITALQSLPQYKGKTWTDSVFDGDNESSDGSINENSYFIKAAKRNFGKDYSLDDLNFLETEFEDWKAKYECNTKAQEEIFKTLAFNQLAQKKARLNHQPTDKLVKEFQALMNTGNITPKQTGMDSMADAQTFGTLIEKWEQEKPIPEPDPEFRDVNKIGYYFTTFFLGHMCKMLGIKNKYSYMYEQEMAKYTVTPPKYDGDEDSERIFEKVFGHTED